MRAAVVVAYQERPVPPFRQVVAGCPREARQLVGKRYAVGCLYHFRAYLPASMPRLKRKELVEHLSFVVTLPHSKLRRSPYTENPSV